MYVHYYLYQNYKSVKTEIRESDSETLAILGWFIEFWYPQKINVPIFQCDNNHNNIF